MICTIFTRIGGIDTYLSTEKNIGMKLLEWLGRVVVLAAILLLVRIWHVVIPLRVKASVSAYSKPFFHYENARNRKNGKAKRYQIRVMAVLGSGGHTTELLKLMKRLDRNMYTPFTFVVAETDQTSQIKTKLDWKPTEIDSFATIPRSREVDAMQCM